MLDFQLSAILDGGVKNRFLEFALTFWLKLIVYASRIPPRPIGGSWSGNRHIGISEASDSGIPEARNIGTAWNEIATEWIGMERHAMEWNGMEWCGMEMK